MPFQELLAKLRGGQITSVDALHAFQYRVGHLDAEESINIIFFLSHARLRRIVSSILPNQKNQPNLDWYLFRGYKISHFPIVVSYLCIGKNQENQPNLVLYLYQGHGV